MVKKVLIGGSAAVAGLVVILAAVIAMQPETFYYERSMKMNAPADVVFEQINDFHRWNDWSPWAKLDPNAKNSFEGSTSGEGAIFTWAGNADVGEGKMTIVESKPAERVKIKLEFIKPMAGVADSLFTFKPEGDATSVTWAMSGKNDFWGKAFSLFMDCEAMIGKEFEKGLASIKAIVEAKPATDTAPSSESVTAAALSEAKSE